MKFAKNKVIAMVATGVMMCSAVAIPATQEVLNNTGVAQSVEADAATITTTSIKPVLVQVNTDYGNLNLRKGYSTYYKIIGKLPKNSYAVATAYSSNGWYKVEYKGQTGWVCGTYLKGVTSTKFTVTTNGANLNVRKYASIRSGIITSVANGSAVYVTKTYGNWAYGTSNGYTGWFSLDWLTLA
jgi:uncharacterized protein YgiM (DUF1202 family)